MTGPRVVTLRYSLLLRVDAATFRQEHDHASADYVLAAEVQSNLESLRFVRAVCVTPESAETPGAQS
jgi:hypothetical protein